MCVATTGTDEARTFDPTRCPLLQGLSVEEADRMMAEDPRIRACVAAIEGKAAPATPCVEGMVRAYDRRAGSSKVA